MSGGNRGRSLRPAIWLVSSFILLLTGCGKDTEPEAVPASFKSVTAAANDIVLSTGGSAQLSFTIKDEDWTFNYDITSPSCQVGLKLSGGGTPEYFKLSSVKPAGSKGSYTATILDLGIEPVYSEQVHLSITFDGKTVLSAPFEVRSEYASSGKTIVRTGLPVMYIDTEGGRGIRSKTEYVRAKLSVNGMGVAEGLDEVSCSVRGRGNTTWEWPKKPYLIKFDEQQHLFGMHKHKRYVLLANLMDPTLMRNIIALKVSSMTSLAWTPGCQSVELVLDGKHMGNYLLVEQVRVDKNRVNVSEDGGGYLLELDFHYDNDIQWISPWGRCIQMWNGIPFGIKYPDSDDITPSQTAYIKSYVEQAASALYGGDFRSADKGYAAYLDVSSFIDYWLVYELMINHELGNPGSVFMHKDSGGKITAGPVWDFDWGVLSYQVSPKARTGLVCDKAIWYARLFEDPAFASAVRKRWNELLPQFKTIPDFIDKMEKTLSASAALDRAMWDPSDDRSMNGGSIVNGDEYLSFKDAVARIRDIYEERLTVISNNL